MRRELVSSVLAIVALTVVLGVGYPLVVTGIARSRSTAAPTAR